MSDKEKEELEEASPMEEDEDEVEMEEEDDDEEGGSEKRQKTLDFSRFLDLEAEAGDDEEDEIEIEEGFEEVAAEAGADAGSGTSGAHHRLMNSIKDFEEAGVNEVALEKRFEYYNAGEDQGVASLVDVPTQGLQPSLLDPKLWMVKTKPGKEREAVIHIMNRFFLKRELGESLNVYSVLAPDHTKGFIFVEADKEPHVRAAIHGIPNVFSFKTTLVPLEQMTSVLRVSNEGVDVTPGMWVRVKRGLYVGDLGMVKSVDPSGTKLEVKLLPRLSLEAEETAEKGKRKKKVDISKRPPPRPFDPEEVTAKLGPGRVQTDQGDESVLYFLNDTYNRDGYLYKTMNIKSLDTVNVHPTLDELQLYHHRGINAEEQPEDKLMRLARMVSASSEDQTFSKGDSVKVVEGGEKGLTGVVKDVNGSNVTVLLTALPGQLSIVELYKSRQLAKHFSVGDHVLIIAGKYKGQTGLVSGVVENLVTIVDDSSLETRQVLSRDIQRSVSVATGLLKLGNFNLHDLVRVGQQTKTAGVIVKIEAGLFRILDQYGVLQTIGMNNMGPKIHQKDAVAYDKQHNTVAQGDLLKVVEGPHRGKQGKVIHLYRFYAFLECREELRNNGVVVAKTDHCVVLGVKKKKETPFSAGVAIQLMSPHTTGSSKPTAAPSSKQVYQKSRREDPLVGKRGRVVRGPQRGYVARVRNALEDRLHVELEATRRLVFINRDEFQPDGGAMPVAGLGSQNVSNMGGGFGAWGDMSGVTPVRHNTPSYMTPSHMTPGRATPAHTSGDDSVWNPNAQTPARPTDTSSWMEEHGTEGGYGSASADAPGWTPSSSDYQPASSGSNYPSVGERGTPAQRTPMQHSGGQFSAAAYGGFSSTQAGYASALHFAASPSGASPSMQPRTTPRQSPGASLMYDPVLAGAMGTPRGPPGAYGQTQMSAETPTELPEHWHLPGAGVIVLPNKEEGAITLVHSASCTVQLDTGEKRDVPKQLMMPMPPVAGRDILVLAGPYLGSCGMLASIDKGGHALVKFASNYSLIPVNLICASATTK